eukprot:365257-Chlamydomonas_euryale.AAC.6
MDGLPECLLDLKGSPINSRAAIRAAWAWTAHASEQATELDVSAHHIRAAITAGSVCMVHQSRHRSCKHLHCPSERPSELQACAWPARAQIRDTLTLHPSTLQPSRLACKIISYILCEHLCNTSTQADVFCPLCPHFPPASVSRWNNNCPAPFLPFHEPCQDGAAAMEQLAKAQMMAQHLSRTLRSEGNTKV